MPEQFSQAETAILAIVQENLPPSLTPYADIAAMTGTSEAEVLALLQKLHNSGVIRRFGASIRHQRTGWTCNDMVAWKATQQEADRCGPIAAQNPNVSHAYFRPSSASDWPYTFYTMVHGHDEMECQKVITDLSESMGLTDYMALRSIRELKKTSMTYFQGVNQHE